MLRKRVTASETPLFYRLQKKKSSGFARRSVEKTNCVQPQLYTVGQLAPARPFYLFLRVLLRRDGHLSYFLHYFLVWVFYKDLKILLVF